MSSEILGDIAVVVVNGGWVVVGTSGIASERLISVNVATTSDVRDSGGDATFDGVLATNVSVSVGASVLVIVFVGIAAG